MVSTLTTLQPGRVVYKVLDGQEIDADVYLPVPQEAPCPVGKYDYGKNERCLCFDI
jgi:hypothetical protein